jgi:hypothetical protein
MKCQRIEGLILAILVYSLTKREERILVLEDTDVLLSLSWHESRLIQPTIVVDTIQGTLLETGQNRCVAGSDGRTGMGTPSRRSTGRSEDKRQLAGDFDHRIQQCLHLIPK